MNLSNLIIVLWYAAISAKLFAAYRLILTGMARRFPVLCGFFVITAVQHAALIAMVGNAAMARRWYAIMEPASLVIEGIMVASLFWCVAEFIPKFRNPGTVLLVGIAALSGLAAYITATVGVPKAWSPTWEAAILTQRYAGFIMAAILGFARLLPWISQHVPARPSARLAVDIMLFHSAVFVLGSAIFMAATAWRYQVVSAVVQLVGSILTAGLCVALLTRASDAYLPVTPVTRADLARILREQDEDTHRSVVAVRDAWHNLP